MSKKVFVHKFWLVAGLSLVVIIFSTDVFAEHWRRSLPSGHEVIVHGGRRYHYNEGRFYRPGFFGFYVSTPPAGIVVRQIPSGCRNIPFGDVTYYNYGNVYYKTCPSGYVVVTNPIISPDVVYAPSLPQSRRYSGQAITIYVPNSNGSYTPVTLVRYNNGYIGPQGEYYLGHPTVEELKVLYGR